MFKGDQLASMSEKDILIRLVNELDEVKRYSAATYASVDKEINEIRDNIKTIMKEVKDNDRQLDKMENYERKLNSIEQSCRNIEKRV